MSGRDYTITSSQLTSGRQSRSRPIFRPGPTVLDCAGPQPNWGTAHATRRCDLRKRPWPGVSADSPERYRVPVSRSISSTPVVAARPAEQAQLLRCGRVGDVEPCPVTVGAGPQIPTHILCR